MAPPCARAVATGNPGHAPSRRRPQGCERGHDEVAARSHRTFHRPVDERMAAPPPTMSIDWPVSVELSVVVAEDLEVVLHHVLHHQRLAVARERRTLRPSADRRFAALRDLHAVDREQDHHAVGLVLRRILGPRRPGMQHCCDPLAVVRHHHAFEAFVADVDRVRRPCRPDPSKSRWRPARRCRPWDRRRSQPRQACRRD